MARENSILLGAYNLYLLNFFSIALLTIKKQKHLIHYGTKGCGLLGSHGMEQKLIRLIKAIYCETQLAVLVNRHLSEWFQMTVDNRQVQASVQSAGPPAAQPP